MDAVFLSRIQFALTSMFHYIYPPLSIGLGVMLVIIEGLYLKTKNPFYQQMAKFWVKVFALTFALGVATGLVQLFGFGTNWAHYSRFVGDVFGSALGAEGIFAFFLESGFLGIMLFGWERVSARVHYFSTICVALGAHFSAIWIVVANSWMQTPTAYKIVGEGAQARAVVTDFWAMVFNPSSVERLVHVVLGCWLAGSFLVVSVCAYYLLRRRHLPFAREGMRLALAVSLVTLILQLFSGDVAAGVVARYQPAKFAAMEGVYTTQTQAPITVVGWVDERAGTVRGIQIPGALSVLAGHDLATEVKGFDQIPPEERPPVQLTFQAFHLMIWMWGLMLFGAGLAWWLQRKKRLEKSRALLWFLIFSVGFPQVANQMGWVTAEVGRQPWLVYGVLKTADGVSRSINSTQVAGSIAMFVVIYLLLFALFLFLLDRKIKQGPEKEHELGDRLYTDPYTTQRGEL